MPLLRPALLLLALLLGVGPAAARPGRAAFPMGRTLFQTYDRDQGFPGAAIHALAQDAQGFLWLGTENGLLRYDGSRLTRWGREDGLPGDWITRLLPHPEGGLWVGTSQGTCWFKDGKGHPLFVDGVRHAYNTKGLDLDDQGRLITFGGGLLLRQTGPDQLSPVRDWPGGPVQSARFGRKSRALWVVSGTEVLRGETSGHWTRLGPAQGLRTNPVEAVEDGHGSLWVVGARSLFRLAPGATRFEDCSAWMPGALTSGGRITLDGDGSLWIPTDAGGLKVGSGPPEVLGAAQGLPTSWVRTFFSDREGNLWVVSNTLHRQLGRGGLRAFTAADGLANEVVWSFAQDASGGIWAATGSGVCKLGPKGWSVVAGTEGASVYSLAFDDRGDLWIGNATGRSLHLPRGAGRALPIDALPFGGRAFWVGKGQDGRMWFTLTNDAGVFAYDPQRRTCSPLAALEPGLAGVSPRVRAEDAAGRVWCLTPEALYCKTGDRWLRLDSAGGLRDSHMTDLLVARDGSVWVCYEDPKGLTHVGLEGGALRVLGHLGRAEGLTSDLVYATQEEPGGALWVATDHGIDRWEKGAVRHFGIGEGLVAEDCNTRSLLLTPEGELWVGTVGGIGWLRTGQLPAAAPAPEARILRVDREGQPPRHDPGSTLPDLPSGKGGVEFYFSSPTYLNESEVRYEARMAGLEEAWRPTPVHQVRYPALPPGTYTFEVRAARPGGAFGAPAQLTFTVTPPWWGTLGFRLLALGALAFLVYRAYRWRTGVLIQRTLDLERIVSTRTEALAQANRELTRANEDLTQALAEVRTLKGFIPICAACKKIRGDQGFWEQIEAYITRHSDASFSHGICPDCAHELYPGLTGRHRKPED